MRIRSLKRTEPAPITQQEYDDLLDEYIDICKERTALKLEIDQLKQERERQEQRERRLLRRIRWYVSW